MHLSFIIKKGRALTFASSQRVLCSCSHPARIEFLSLADGLFNFFRFPCICRYKVWHYSGQVLYEENTPTGKELWEVSWQPMKEGLFPPPRLSSRPGQSSQTQMPPTPGISASNVQGNCVDFMNLHNLYSII